MTVLGIVIKPKGRKFREKAHERAFEFEFGEGTRGNKLFYSNGQLQQMIQKNPGVLGKEMGYITYGVDPSTKRIELYSYYPFHMRNFTPLQPIIGKGIASQLERRVLRHLKEKYPGFSYVEASTALKGRRTQLRKRKIRPGQKIRFKTAIRKMQQTTRKWKQRKRG